MILTAVYDVLALFLFVKLNVKEHCKLQKMDFTLDVQVNARSK